MDKTHLVHGFGGFVRKNMVMVIALLLFNQIHITYRKWYCTFFGFTCYNTRSD